MRSVEDLLRHRLRNQGLVDAVPRSPAETVAWLGAVQAQDYAGAKWALAQRGSGLTDAALDRAFTEGAILRTHVLRPTWHFVAPEDLPWMLELTGPRVHAVNAGMYRQVGLDKSDFKRCQTVLKKILRGAQLTRSEIAAALDASGVNTDRDFRMAYILMQAELDGLICSGGRRGKQFTYALLEERAPRATSLDREAALAELVRRYVVSHGPAQLQDFTVWSGLTLADARQGVEANGRTLQQVEVEGKEYWCGAGSAAARFDSPAVHLLPNYDEYFVGFKDRSAIEVGTGAFRIDEQTNRYTLSAHIVFIDGKVAGGWRRTLKKKSCLVELAPLRKLSRAEKAAILRATNRYGEFLELPVEISWKDVVVR